MLILKTGTITKIDPFAEDHDLNGFAVSNWHFDCSDGEPILWFDFINLFYKPRYRLWYPLSGYSGNPG
jgi:hypothetical protein